LSTDKIKDHGIVTRWNRSYGYIRPNGTSEREIYVSLKCVLDRQLVVGARVAYHLAPDLRFPNRLRAVDVEIVR
jgi:hypothetical protein